MGSKLKALLSELDLYIGTILLSTAILSTGLQVTLRYVFNRPLPWPEELCVICLVWITFLGGSQVTRKNNHLTVEYFTRFIPKRLKFWNDILLDLITLVYLIMVIWGSKHMLEQNAPILTSAFEISVNYILVAVPINFTIIAVFYFFRLVKKMKNHFKGSDS
jgi:TRAP-type C4-dicarboxylate transport system permease small subunit